MTKSVIAFGDLMAAAAEALGCSPRHIRGGPDPISFEENFQRSVRAVADAHRRTKQRSEMNAEAARTWLSKVERALDELERSKSRSAAVGKFFLRPETPDQGVVYRFWPSAPGYTTDPMEALEEGLVYPPPPVFADVVGEWRRQITELNALTRGRPGGAPRKSGGPKADAAWLALGLLDEHGGALKAERHLAVASLIYEAATGQSSDLTSYCKRACNPIRPRSAISRDA